MTLHTDSNVAHQRRAVSTPKRAKAAPPEPNKALRHLLNGLKRDKRAVVAWLRTGFAAIDGGEILVGWHLVDLGLMDRGHALHGLLDGRDDLPAPMLEAILAFTGQRPETFCN